MRRNKNIGVALIGLLVVAATSMAAASGRKPATEQQQSAVSLRRVSVNEVMGILNQFPEMLPSYFVAQKNDTGFLRDLFPFSEVTSALLERAFPGVRFYKGLDFGISPPYPYLTAIAGGKRYMMPGNFNRLLVDNGQKVTDGNIIELAKAFVLLAVGSEPIFVRADMPLDLDTFPPVIFLQEKRTCLKTGRPTENAAVLKVKTGERTESWHFSVLRGQFKGAARVDEKGLIKDFPSAIVESPPGRGQLYPTPNMAIDTFPTNGDAYVEYDTLNNAHYYIVVERNGAPTGNKVVLSLSGFPPTDTNVYVRVRDSIRHATRWLDKVQMSSGSGSDTWTPPVDSTGICVATAGYADDSNPGGTYQAITPERELTPEKLKAATFPGATTESLKIYLCDQFFRNHPDSEAHAPVFAQYAKDAMLESWQRQVNIWGLGAPPDTDHRHQVFINDNQNWYHWVPGGAWAISGANRQVGLPYSLWYRDSIDSSYSSESIRVKVAVAHEFYHGIQWGLDPDKWVPSQWKWFEEGQARFLPSAQYETEEFIDANHLFPDAANSYLTQYLNTSPRTLGNYPILGYPYCLFWRYMYENFGRDSGGVQLVKDCYAESVGIGNSVGQGKLAIDRAILKYWQVRGRVRPGYGDFLEVLDQFAVASYLNDTSFHL
jgi:hypothetical protein